MRLWKGGWPYLLQAILTRLKSRGPAGSIDCSSPDRPATAVSKIAQRRALMRVDR